GAAEEETDGDDGEQDRSSASERRWVTLHRVGDDWRIASTRERPGPETTALRTALPVGAAPPAWRGKALPAAPSLPRGVSDPCPNCGVSPRFGLGIHRVVTDPDHPIQALMDSLLASLSRARHPLTAPASRLVADSKGKILVFSDGRQDAAYLAADYQR